MQNCTYIKAFQWSKLNLIKFGLSWLILHQSPHWTLQQKINKWWHKKTTDISKQYACNLHLFDIHKAISKLTKLTISLVRSLAKSKVTKQDNALRAIPVSYITGLCKSFLIKFVVNINTSVPSWKHCDAAMYLNQEGIVNLRKFEKDPTDYRRHFLCWTLSASTQ